ncbi:protein-export chaperone SecB [Wenzhouxiangella sp. AB-CW3]|uniref:protein-export chaperone SecB n=1 Tax=Wenzhouxiangella sp. AB-CW3 TaxID=2771012 RepID=UPI00168B2F63|nr:protein-export chaperone SecB [Wenzhouxiangella sp. AB-CW3]QOC23242.1 protein-export chaperone SecB [Wenzhouxiangella sp. AB-CW3]
MNSPLQLEHYFFERMHCVANADISAEEIQDWHRADDSRFGLRVELGTNPDSEHEWQVAVDFYTSAEYDKKSPYELHFKVIGFFQVDEAFEHDNLERLIRVNGSSVLYSAMRELVALFTSRAPWGPVQLPTVNFRLLSPEDLVGTHAVAERKADD